MTTARRAASPDTIAAVVRIAHGRPAELASAAPSRIGYTGGGGPICLHAWYKQSGCSSGGSPAMGSACGTTERLRSAEQDQGSPAPDDISAGEYVAEDDRVRPYGYCAVPRHATQPSLRARTEQARRRGRSRHEDDGN